jgi:large subunit ribosomal protein L28
LRLLNSGNNLSGGRKNMSKVCSVCGKGQASGNNVSHSKRRTRRTFKANVQKVSYVNAEGKVVNDYVCTRCLKTVERA